MEKITFDSHGKLADYMCSFACRGTTVYAVLNYKDAAKLLKELISYKDVKISDIVICSPDMDGYDKEYYVIIDDELYVSCEKAYHDKNEYNDEGYFNFGNPYILALFDGDVNSRIIKSAEGSVCKEIEIVDYTNCIKLIQLKFGLFFEE